MPEAADNSHHRLEHLFDVNGKVALVTGGGSGIGLMQAQALAVNGAKVYIVSRTPEKLERAAEAHGPRSKGSIIPLKGDVTSKSDIKCLLDDFKSKEPMLHVLVNAAGVSSTKLDTDVSGSAEELSSKLFHDERNTFEDWTDSYRSNVSSCYFMTTAFLPLLAASTEAVKGWSGVVINVTSMSGITKDSQAHYAYNASKAAVNHLTTMLAADLAKRSVKVRVNAIAPGYFPSEMTANASDDQQKSKLDKEKFEDKVPAKRPGHDRDMANAVLFVATNQYLNGQIVTLDGGFLIGEGS